MLSAFRFVRVPPVLLFAAAALDCGVSPPGPAKPEPTRVDVPAPSAEDLARKDYHPVNREASPAPEPGQEDTALLSPLDLPGGGRIATPAEWTAKRRPELIAEWTKILGKIAPSAEDRKWFGDITQARVNGTEETEHYTRIDLDIPIEIDFFQKHLLLLPKGQGSGPFPAVIAWTSTSPDYREPEKWWGEYLASNGYVVLTSWAFIRHYRQDSNYGKGAPELVHERFGRWMPMAKMVHDAEREAEYLRSRPEVDGKRIGFIGFSLSAKSALYIAAFAPSIIATVSVDPHVAINGNSNYYDKWYLDWQRKFDDIQTDDYPVPELRGTVQSLLNPDVARPGFERDHHELLALAAPHPVLVIGGNEQKSEGRHSDGPQSWAYINRARDVYELLGVPERLYFVLTDGGHAAISEIGDRAWKTFFRRWLQGTPVENR